MKRFFSRNKCSHIIPITKTMKEIDPCLKDGFVCMDKLRETLKNHTFAEPSDKNNHPFVCAYHPGEATKCPDYKR